MNAFAAVRDKVRAYGPQLRYGMRVTVAGLAGFAIARSLNFPLHGLWAVLTAIIVSQVSVGGSLRATVEYNIGTLSGAVYAAVVGLIVPHSTPVSQAVALALAVGPMALAASLSPSFRVAPFSAVLVLLIGSELGESAILSGLTRIVEVAIGGGVAIVVSLLVFPQRAHRLGLEAACRTLDLMAELLPKLLANVSRDVNKAQIASAQNNLGSSVTAFQGLAEEAKRERIVSIAPDPDPAPLSRALLRVRHDLVILGRATAEPFPDTIARRLERPLTRFGEAASAFLRGSATALAAQGSPPSSEPALAALDAYDAEITLIRDEGLSKALATDDAENLFALGFALEQFYRDSDELAQRIQEIAKAKEARRPS